MQSGMLADQAADPKIAFSLSERSFALFPPLEHHDGSFPPLAPPSVEPTPSFNDVDDAYPVKAEAGMLGVRGDSFVNGLSQLGTSPELTMSNLMVAAALSYPAPPHKHGPIVMVCSYTEFDDLAHGPRGTEATRAVRTYRLDLTDGSLTLLSALPQGDVHNPAFCRRHPRLNIVYACTESVKQDGQVIALHLDGKTGAMREHCPPVSACGTSTCYLTIHKVRAATPEREPLAQPLSRADRRTPLSARTPGITHTPSRTRARAATSGAHVLPSDRDRLCRAQAARRMLLVNYWDSTICTLELLPDGKLGRHLATYDPKGGKAMKARADKHVNHSLNDESAQAERQGDPHSHAIVLEPTMGSIAYVPDLGMDVIRQVRAGAWPPSACATSPRPPDWPSTARWPPLRASRSRPDSRF